MCLVHYEWDTTWFTVGHECWRQRETGCVRSLIVLVKEIAVHMHRLIHYIFPSERHVLEFTAKGIIVEK